MNIKFNITPTRTNFFSKAQSEKVDAGVEIFKQVLNSDEFFKRVKNFQWRTSDGIAFNRFYLSRGMSNQQVGEAICRGLHRQQGLINVIKSNVNIVINIVPCGNRQEAESVYNNTITCCLGIDVVKLNHPWYSPVHVACALMHEWCCWNGFSYGDALVAKMENWSGNTVPIACAWITKDIAASVCNSPEVSTWSSRIKNKNFDYCACSITYSMGFSSSYCSPVLRLDELINLLEKELSWLTTCENKTPDISNRIAVLSKSLKLTNQMKLNLCNTTLDGSEWMHFPVNTISLINSN